MEEEEGNGAATPPLEPRQHELLAAAVREGNTPAAAVLIPMNFEGSCENFLQPAPPPSDSGARSSAGYASAVLSTCSRPKILWALHLWVQQEQQHNQW